MNQKTILTGDRPTGPLHIGHYFGSLVNRKKLEKEYQTFLIIADLQALTDNWDNPDKVRNNIYEVAADNIALGIDLDRTTIFIQSQIPQIAELTVFYSNLVTINRLKRNPTVKTEIDQKKDKFGEDGESLTFGFLGYPISQAADITVVRADVVPVGEDQLPVLEQTQDIVEKFNRIYKTDLIPVPKAILSEGARVLGLDGNAKMSKSLNNCVFLRDTGEETMAKIKSAKTDSYSEINYDPINRPEVSNLVLLYSLLNDFSIDEAVSDVKNLKYVAFKIKLAEDINEYFREFRQKRNEVFSNPKFIKETLEIGRERTLKKANETLSIVKRAMKIDY